MKDKGVIVSFRVDRHLADVLNRVPDKSSFIRDVIVRSFYESCPVCRGRGVVPAEISRWAAKQLKSGRTRECHCCLYAYPEASLPKRRRDKQAGRDFLCPHCHQHQHAH